MIHRLRIVGYSANYNLAYLVQISATYGLGYKTNGGMYFKYKPLLGPSGEDNISSL